MTCLHRYRSIRLFLVQVLLAIPFLDAHAQSGRTCGFEGTRSGNASSIRAHAGNDDETMNVPVVFHIVYSNEEQNIAGEQIQWQLNAINEDFSRTNADATETLPQFRDVAGNANIRFYLAGVTRTETIHGPFGNDDLHYTSRGGADAWDTEKYLNVWVGDLGGGLFGYASEPGAPAFRDGVAIHHTFFGKQPASGSLGRTLTHEIGHWLGLKHLWGNGGCDNDDGIADTPVQDNPVAGCDLSYTSCGGLSMVQNFMNSSMDACMNLFTIEQSTYMRQTLEISRPDVFSRGALITEIASESENAIKGVYPNPLTTGSQVRMEVQAQNGLPLTLSVLDITGRVVTSETIEPFGSSVEIDFTQHPNGVYVARINHSAGAETTRIIVNRKL